jgi:hypothetical protein
MNTNTLEAPKGTALSNARQTALQNAGVVLSRNITELPTGTVCLANDSLLRNTEVIEELNLFAASYDSMTGNGLARLRDFLTPPRPSNSRIVRLTTFNENEPWETVDYNKVKRGILADFAEVRQRTATKTDFQINNRGLSVVLDRDELKDRPEWQQVHTKWLIDLLNRATVQEALAIYTAAATTGAKTWSSGSPNPDLDIRNYLLTAANTTGFYPLNVAYGDAAFLLRAQAYESELTAGSMARAGIYTEEQLATALGVQAALINMERYQNTSTAKAELIGSNVLLFSGVKDALPMDPSNIVRHIVAGAGGSGEYAVYITEMGVKKIMLTVENYEYLHTQHTTGIYKIAVS